MMENLHEVRRESRSTWSTDNKVSIRPPQKLSVSNVRRGAEDIACDGEQWEWPPQSPPSKFSRLGPFWGPAEERVQFFCSKCNRLCEAARAKVNHERACNGGMDEGEQKTNLEYNTLQKSAVNTTRI